MKALRALLAALLTLGPQSPALAASVINSKHNLSAGSATTGPKATAETQVCVFCHTPHKPGLNVPLWNKTQTAQTFTFYSSNYVNTYLGMTAPAMGALAGTRTKLCLSCHDGVTALGGVYNLGGAPGTIAMNTTPLGAAANIGVDLSNDHPVLYDVKPGAGPPTAPGTNPEIQLPLAGDKVRVYGATNRVECTSCHNPHDNQFPKFLVKSNASAAICTTCHVKTGYAGSAHQVSAVSYTPAGGAATTVGEWSCRNCHKAHGTSSAQAYLLSGAEEATCYTCHGNPPLTGAKNIKASYLKTYKHPTETVSAKHMNPEQDGANFTYSPTNNRHAECQDCHNPHQAKTGNRLAKTTPSNLITNVLLGQWGVEPAYGTTAWVPASSYTRQVFANTTGYKEYQLCLKCHSSYAFGSTPPVGITDQTIEFNPNNAARHPVLTAGTNPYTTPTTTNGNIITMEPPWNQTANSHNTMMCSDCHGSDTDTDPEGPHGSAQVRILQRSLVTTAAGGTPLCVKCHKAAVYVSGGSGSRFREHGRSAHQILSTATGAGGYGGCLTCHGNFVGTNFHGENHQWAATSTTNASPAYRFLNNSTTWSGWHPGECQLKTAGTCNNGHNKTY